jgi:hypothetical protein
MGHAAHMRLLPVLPALVLILAAAVPAQQLAISQNDNLSYGSYAVGWPSSVLAFRFTAPAAMTIDAAQVFTGNESPAQHSVEIRTRNVGTGLPDLLVGQPGTWQVVHARCWQGSRLQQPAVLAANTDYFLVWRVQGMFPQHSVSDDNYPGNVLTEERVSDGSSWFAQTMVPAKFRLYTPYAGGSVQTYGTAKPGIYGNPTIGVEGFASIGSPLDVWLDNAARVSSASPPNAILVIGWPIPAGIPFGFATAYVTGEVLLFQRPTLHTSPTSGAVSYTLFVPNTPVAIGLPVSFQWGVFDAAAAQGFSHSAAVTATLQ